MEQILQDNNILPDELATPEGRARRMEALQQHIKLLQEMFAKPEDITGFTFAFATDEKMACGVFGPSDEIKDCLLELLQKTNYVLSQE